MGNQEYGLLSETHTDWPLHDKTFWASRETLPRVSEKTTNYKRFFSHSVHWPCVCSCMKILHWNVMWCDTIRRTPIGSSCFPELFSTLLFLSLHWFLTNTLFHIHALSHSVTDWVLAWARSFGRGADGAVLLSSTCPVSANHSQDQAQLCKITGFMACNNNKHKFCWNWRTG